MAKHKSSQIYQYYPESKEGIRCIICRYKYKRDAPMSTLQKHLRVKHSFSVRHPLSQEELDLAVTQASLVSSGLEESIAEWLFQERIPISAIKCQSFMQIFEHIDSSLILPTSRRIEHLLNRKIQIIPTPDMSEASITPDQSLYDYFTSQTSYRS
ncbi:hypothetical protein DSO57_1002030 [Entomophthora muscae]|uniref:Uncharacterized protein n=1 Tax=Entomophthora muscae TaxID=34485 RepID=A0ACC2SAX7_9FUNG|nr:hypothetical protein DSO57_1002030 [Entomophthora muscae]